MARAEQGVHAAAAIDALVSGPVLVTGSPPPGGRDLDLLAPPREHEAISRWLRREGYVARKNLWAKLDSSPPYSVDLTSTDDWSTTLDDGTSLLADAEPLPGHDHLVTPGPVTVLLLAARGTVARRGRLTDKAARRVGEALERDPAAWSAAEARARDLGMRGALGLLRRAYEQHGPLPTAARIGGLAGVLAGSGPLVAKAQVLALAAPRRRRPPIVSFSGLDGSGKSTQAEALAASLDRLGLAPATQWGGAFKTGSKLRSVLAVLDRSPHGVGPGDGAGPAHPSGDRMVPAALARHALGRQLWAVYVALLNVVHLWSLVLRRRPGARVLLFDRFTPDIGVRLDLHFRCNRGWNATVQRLVFRLLAPKPDLAFLVAVSGDVAYSRRQEQTPQELDTTAWLYAEHAPRFGLVRLDGTRPPEELQAEVLDTVWRCLP